MSFEKSDFPDFNGDSVLFLNVSKAYPYGRSSDLYECTRGVWKLSYDRANNVDYVLPHKDGKILAVFKLTGRKWHRIEDEEMYPDAIKSGIDFESRFEFDGEEVCDAQITSRYVGKYIPTEIAGLQNPVSYWPKEIAHSKSNEKATKKQNFFSKIFNSER